VNAFCECILLIELHHVLMNVGTCCHGEVQSNGGSKGKPALPEVEGKRPRDIIEEMSIARVG
jgi:hypothetical protein